MLDRLLQQARDLITQAESALARGEPQAIVERAPLLVRTLRALAQADARLWPAGQPREQALALMSVQLTALQQAAARAQSAAARHRTVLFGASQALVYDEAGRPRGTAPPTTHAT